MQTRMRRLFEAVTPEHIMLVVLVLLGVMFYTVPIIEDFPDNARVFPQMMAAIVTTGSVLLLLRRYLPGPIQTFVAESVSLASDIEEQEAELVEEEVPEREATDDRPSKDEPLHVAWGYDVNNTVIMMVFSTVYLALGWAAGLLYVTPFFIFGYTSWFRVRWYYGVALAVLATLIIYGFVEFIAMPFDRGEIVFTRGLI